MSALQRHRQADEIERQEEEQRVTDEDLTALESEDHIQAIRQEVYRDIEQTIGHLACGAAGPRIAYSVDKQGLKGLRAGYRSPY